MTLTRHMKSFALVIFFLVLHCNLSFSRHHGIRHGRHKRNHGAHLYLTGSSIIPGGEGGPNDRWGEWGAPSECSRSCGGGVAYQTRECHNVDADGRPKCRGGNKKYFSCNTQDCPDDEIDFRQQQCSHFDQQPFEGLRYEWVPYTKAPNPCELNCMPRGERFYYRHKLRVIDGTRCNDESLDVCVDGTCQPVGCDMMIGSNSTEDKCRKCSGDGSTCKTESGLLDTNYLLVGYNDILLIPAGATNIEIKEVAPSNNYLAIRNKTGNYYLNGNWRIDFPRTMFFAGCYWHYERKPQGFAAPDHLKCLGPTSEPIFLVLLQQDRNVGIKYEYFIPEAEHLSESDTYSWTFTQFGTCSVSCGGGFQTRNVTCNKMQTLEPVESKLCEIKTKPSDTQQCNQESCPPQWNEGDWSKCSAPCGNNGTQEREVHCERIDAHGKASKIADAVCASEIGKKPTAIQECNADLVCPEWYLGPWLPCDKLCDDGVQKRTVKCYRKEDNEITILEDDECSEQKPEITKACMLRPCEGIDWITTAWSGCKACGQTKETRTAYCGTKQGKIYGNNLCDAAKKPDRVRECSGPPCEFQWYTSQWSKCSSQCNDGVQTRNVVCGAFDGSEIHKASDESKCDVALKPNTTRDCVPKDDECVGEWFAGPWDDCSKECGGGSQNRIVVCLVNGTSVKPTLCNQADILFSMTDCNTEKCSDDDILPLTADDTVLPDSSEEDDEEYDEMVECDYSTEITEKDDGVLKVTPTESVDFDGAETSYATESTLRDDEVMLSDGTGFELAPKSTSMPLSTVEGSGDDDEGSGDGSKSTSVGLDITSDIEGSAESSLVTEEAISSVQSTLLGSSVSSDSDESTTEGGSTTVDGLSTTTDSGLTTTESGSSVSDLSSTAEDDSSVTTDSVSSSESGSTTTSGLSTDGSDITTESGATSSESASTTESIVSSTTEGGSTGSTDDSSTTAGSSSDGSSTAEGSSTEGSSTTEAGSTDGISTTVDSGTGTTEPDFLEITEETIIPKGLDTQKDVKPTEVTTDDLSTEASGSSETSDSGTATTPSGLSSTSESGSSSSVGSSLSAETESSTTAGSSLSTETESSTTAGSSLSTESGSSTTDGSSVSTESGSSTTAGSSVSTESGSSLSPSDETTETATTGSSISDATTDSTSGATSDTTSDQTSDTTSDQTSDSTSDHTTDSTQSSESTPTPDSSSTSDGTTPTSSSDETTLSTDDATGTTDSAPSSTTTSDGSTLSTDDVSSTTDSATTPGASTSDDGASSISTDAKSTDVDGSSTTDSSISTTTDSGLSTETTLDLLTETGDTSTVDGSSTTKDGSTTETSDASSTSDKSTEISSVGSSDGSSTTTDGSTTVSDISTTDDGSTTETTLDGSSLKSTDSDGTTASSGLSDLTTEGSSDSTTQGSTDLSSDGSTTEGVSTTTDGTTGSTDDATTASPLSTEFESTVEGSGSTTDDDSTISTVFISTDGSSKSTDVEGSTQSTTEGSSISTDIEGSTQSTTEGSSISTDSDGSTQSTTEGSSISTDIEGSTQSTTEGSSLSTDIEGSTQSTIEGSTVSTIEDTTIDIWTTTGSSSDATKYDDQTTPNTLITAIELEGSSKRPKLCKRKKKAKKPSCTIAKFGCCPDGKTKAKGPFDEGCNVPKTCNETTHGCCPDGLSPATGKNNEGCPPSICNQTLFGCCPDDYTTAEGADFEGCPIETTTTDMPTETTDSSTTEASSGSTDLTDTTETGETTESSLSTVSEDELSTQSTIPAAMHCAQSTYGCCPDGVSEATGENFHGCDIIDKDNCTNSYYGCCDDGQTAALGANGDGCASCIHAQFGCCPDNQHPAHGPLKEGCCLNSQFGCCPDNILEAQGPQLEGCGCQYSSYGCCPDNVTSARGYENDGCGCEFAPHGCCSDQLTAAKGANFAGCPCHTSQFGCCPDGITIPQGPHGYGCHCTHSTFKCCGDEVTPAQGPDAQGCTCANSEFGCCPDGVTDAKGANFEQCQNIPESPQVSCALPSERGECSNYTVKYYFDANYGGCSRFWYGGCGGNGNKFDSQDDCEEVCVKPENKAVCDLPQVKGACDGYFPMYYYDTESKICSQFIYGGCLGNNNRFQTREECLQLCSVDDSISTCEQPVAEGPCNGTFERWYFDKDTEVCQPFNYGGCKGNKNNFATKHACLYNCKKPGVLRDTCKLDKHEGECSDTEARWYFSESDNKCMPFYFTGCGGNKNNYETFEDCEQSCPKQIDLDLCHFPAEIGDCQNYTTKWYFDTRESNCRQFYYGGCGGNKNNFDTEDACLNQCSPQPTTPPHIPSEPFNIGHCSLPDDVGPGKRYENRWAYHPEDGLCHQFVYGGYGGNQNNFESSNECEAKCADSQDPCQLPAIQGSCDENITRWYFDNRAGSCLEFLYSGCGSNRNNFYTVERCEERCGRKEPETDEHDILDLDTTVPLESSGESDDYPTTKMVVDIETGTDSSGDEYCNEPLDYGDDSCDDPRESIAYYYNSGVQRCEAFVYIGCGGNGNRFDTESQCERQCGVSKGQDVCSEPHDLGPCDEWVIKYFYNTETKTCNQFYYGGCEGNGNRFDSNAECESICIAREEPISNKAICLLRPSSGKCNTTEDFSSKRYYYDDLRGTCMVFIYSGCAGNQNNFKTLKSCHDFCSDGTKAPEVHYTSAPAPPQVEPDVQEHVDPDLQGQVEPEEHQPCQAEQEHCNQLNCPYGISKEYNDNSCEICACDDPCHNHVCPEDSRCSVDFVPDDQQTHDSPIFIAICRQVRKPGECPVLSNSTRCERECYEDSDCRGDKKCCVAGCGFNCVPPVEERAPTTAGPETPSPYLVIPGGVASVLETKPEAEVNVNVTEGGVATLRCFATGYPYPTIQWQKGGLTINTAVGRYHLTSTGDLQIVQLHKTDSGSYVCVADNGLGPPVRRVVELSVDRQTTIPAYIIGDKNSTQIVTLNQPATLRCLAGGVPNVYISWWKGKNLIPYTDTISQRFEITKDYSLVFKRVDLSDLGTYLCEAYSGLGKPVSIQVTLKAIGPVHISKPEDEIYRQYLVAVPEAPKPSYPYRPTPVAPPRLPPHEDRQKMPRILATAHIRFPNGTQFEPNRPIVLECIVTGSPKVAVRWYKDERELDPSRLTRIIEIDEEGSSRLTISNSTKDDTGYYKCEAVNSHSKAYHTEYLVVEGVYVPASCTDNQFFANCGLIVEGNYCNHKYYSKFCCRSCTLAGQLSWSHPNNI